MKRDARVGSNSIFLAAGCEDVLRHRFFAKRMECVELAPAFERFEPNNSGGKPHALHTLREIWMRPVRAALYRRAQLCATLNRYGEEGRDACRAEAAFERRTEGERRSNWNV